MEGGRKGGKGGREGGREGWGERVRTEKADDGGCAASVGSEPRVRIISRRIAPIYQLKQPSRACQTPISDRHRAQP